MLCMVRLASDGPRRNFFKAYISALVDFERIIGEGGFEPPTFCSQSRRNSRYPTPRMYWYCIFFLCNDQLIGDETHQ